MSAVRFSVHELHFKIGLDYGRGFTKLIICLLHENSVNDLVYLWVGSAPENDHNFSVILKNNEITYLIESYHVSFTFDLKSSCTLSGNNVWSTSLYMVYMETIENGLSKVDWQSEVFSAS